MKTAILMLGVLCLLGGCKSELYSKLDEAEANQMLALLIYNKIQADKTVDKEGVTLRVEQEHFVDAVEVLRQNGLPRRRTVTMQDLFPSGQLVSSPEQEEAKLNYLKSQQIEKMLSSMDGVIHAEVSVAEPRAAEGEDPAPTSTAVFIKYSPEVNLPAHEAEILALIRNGIPGLTPDRISLTLQRAQYHYQPPVAAPAEHPLSLSGLPFSLSGLPFSLSGLPPAWLALMAAGATALLGMITTLCIWWRRRVMRTV
ncbi:type III secretion system inner membrane ring lipoprotein SctJ [Aeromonas jandaei]|uniref:type III secretion system inner membrane ring lipoprotein SctJ n=1 Tax=Aeromonas jandaei TaxID=650 RepID=UPI003BA05D67